MTSGNLENYGRLFSSVNSKIHTLGANLVGSMPKQEFVKEGFFDEDGFLEQRERRLAMLLSKEVRLDESKWLGYNFETSQVKIDVTDMILEDLIHEICLLLNYREASPESLIKRLPQEIVDLFESRKVDPNKPPEFPVGNV